MTRFKRFTGTALALVAALAPTVPASAQGRTRAKVADLPAGTQRPTAEVLLSIGQGQLVTLPADVSDVWTSNPGAADVYVTNPRQIYLFGKDFGEATVFATTKAGRVVYATNVRTSGNINSVDRMLKAAMPDAAIKVLIAGQVAVLQGTVATPDDAAQAQSLALAYLNPGVNTSEPNAQLKMMVVNRLKTATPLQVNLQVRIAEVNRSLIKEIGTNLITRDTTGGFQFGITQGRNFGTISNADLGALPQLDASTLYGLPAGTLRLPFDPRTGQFITQGARVGGFTGLGAGRTTIGTLGRLFGLDISTALDLAETDGLVTTLATPNLTALSGETASFLAGGEVPIPQAQGLGAVSVEYKQYGVSLAFTPMVMSDGRISLRVRPEVSELSTEGAVRLNGFEIPGITTRRAETTVELGSGQSFVIGGLLRAFNANTFQKAPGAGDIPILGALFRSNSFRRAETELMIVVTPYLVKPISANQVALPTDGYVAPHDLERVLLGQSFGGHSGEQRPKPTMAPPATVIGNPLSAVTPPPAVSSVKPKGKTAAAAIGPGFSK